MNRYEFILDEISDDGTIDVQRSRLASSGGSGRVVGVTLRALADVIDPPPLITVKPGEARMWTISKGDRAGYRFAYGTEAAVEAQFPSKRFVRMPLLIDDDSSTVVVGKPIGKNDEEL